MLDRRVDAGDAATDASHGCCRWVQMDFAGPTKYNCCRPADIVSDPRGLAEVIEALAELPLECF
jgi:hypothetical protein